MTDPQFLDFNQKWMEAVLPHLVDGGILGTFIDWRGLADRACSRNGSGVDPSRSGRMGKNERRHGQSLPIPARVTAAFQERRRRKRQQHFAWQARTASHQLVDLSRASSVGSGARKGLQRSSDGETNRHAAGCADRPVKPWRNCSRPLPRLRVYSYRRREYRAGVPRHRARSTLRRCHYPTL